MVGNIVPAGARSKTFGRQAGRFVVDESAQQALLGDEAVFHRAILPRRRAGRLLANWQALVVN
jgi:hypothetical protein